MVRKSEQPRAANFSQEEESLLLRIVKRHNSVIENRKTDAVTNALKAQEWEKVEKEFNSQNVEHPRDTGTLRRKYENIKRGIKKKLRGEKLSVTKKRDGPPEKVIFNDEEIKLVQVMGLQATGLQNTHRDKDATHDNQITKSSFMEIDQTKDNSEVKIETESDIVVKTEVEAAEPNESLEISSSTSSAVVPQSLVTPSNTGQTLVGQATKHPKAIPCSVQCSDPTLSSSLLQSPHPALRTRKRDCSLEKMSAWAISKTDIAEQELDFTKESYEQKKKHLEEEHALRIQLLKQQLKLLEQQLRHAEEQQSWLREEHLEKMKNIKSSQ